MRRSREIIRLFLASPADVVEERSVVEGVVAEINRSIAPFLGVLVELVRWEDVVPGIGSRAQQIVLDQADIEECDIFVGVLWDRFGTPTGRADSGTEEEFQIAHQAWQRSGRPRIMVYFCQRPSSLRSRDQTEQKAKVLQFRETLSSLGIVRDFATTRAFEAAIRQDLTKHLLTVTEPVGPRRPENGRGCRGGPVVPQTCSAPWRASTHPGHTPPGDMVPVAAGEFLSGKAGTRAAVNYRYLIDRALVTTRDFVAFLDETGYMLGRMDRGVSAVVERWRESAKTAPDHPVTHVTWHDAATYAAWRGKRLPTEMEWEKAARGPDGLVYPWGDEFSPARCNSIESGIGGTTPVWRYENGRSPYGCLDMAGNVFEWTCDWARRPRLLRKPYSEAINRGGSYNRPSDHLVCWYAESDLPALRMADVGFRCVIGPEAP